MVGHQVITGKETQNKWLDYWYGIENGIMDEPMVDVQRENKTWQKIKIGQIQQLYLQKSYVFKQ